MASRPRLERAGAMTVVRLSQVPLPHRLLVANRVIRVEGLVGVPALEMLLAAQEPTEDPWLLVTAAAARNVGAQ